MVSIKKAIIPVAGLGTRFLPLSKVLAKELFPLADKPTVQYIVEEAAAAGIQKIILVNSPDKKEEIQNYLTRYLKRVPKLENILRKRKKFALLKEIEAVEKIGKKLSFSQVFQKEQLGDGHAVLQAKNKINREPCLVLFGDDIVDSKIPCAKQLIKVFDKYRVPVIALYRLPKERLPFYGIVKVKKAGPRLYQILDIEEKPAADQAPSNLAIVGKYIITPKVFNFLKKSPRAKGEIRLAGAFQAMIKKGLTIYGYEFEGKWLECGNKLGYLQSNFYLSLKHPRFGKELKRFLKKENL